MRFTYHTGAKPLAGYTIHRGIHRGGFGEVYFAHSDAGKEVALKLLHHEERDVEIRGVSQCLNLKHPNLVSLFDLKTDSLGDHWIVMEYVSGSSLEDVLVSFPNGLPPDEVRDWLKGLVAGVSHLHDRGIVHRDLKPANVYRENGIVKIGDVGLSKRIDSDRQRLQTQSVGTVYYMAPEVAKGQYGPEVDVYSLGVMLYELITGKLPFQGETTGRNSDETFDGAARSDSDSQIASSGTGPRAGERSREADTDGTSTGTGLRECRSFRRTDGDSRRRLHPDFETAEFA